MPQYKQTKQTLKIGYCNGPTWEQVTLASEVVMLLRIETCLKLIKSRFLVFRHNMTKTCIKGV